MGKVNEGPSWKFGGISGLFIKKYIKKFTKRRNEEMYYRCDRIFISFSLGSILF